MEPAGEGQTAAVTHHQDGSGRVGTGPAGGVLARTSAAGGRIRGVDAARALAVVGMVMVHFGPQGGESPADAVYSVTHGRASLLFALLAGVGVALSAGERSRERLRLLDRKLAVRAAVLLPLGLALQMLPSGVAVILQFYALYFLAAALAVRLADRWVLTIAVGAAVVGPVVLITAQRAVPEWFEVAPATLADVGDPLFVLRELLLSGHYPVIVWTAPVVFGVWLGRRDLRSRAVRWGMVAVGAVTVAAAYAIEALVSSRVADGVSYGQLVATVPHSGMTMWVVQGTGAAVAVLGLCLLVADAAPRVAWPAVATGQLAFTVYVVHLLLLSWWPEWFVRETVGAAVVTVARFTLVTVVLATLWRAVLPRGPLETVMNLPWERPFRHSHVRRGRRS